MRRKKILVTIVALMMLGLSCFLTGCEDEAHDSKYIEDYEEDETEESDDDETEEENDDDEKEHETEESEKVENSETETESSEAKESEKTESAKVNQPKKTGKSSREVKPLVLISKEEIEDSGVTQYIYDDPVTMILFSYFSNSNGPIEMHNADGTPRIYDGKSEVKTLVLILEEGIENVWSTQYNFYDPETLVMYVYFSNCDDSVSEMHDVDGTLRTYDPTSKKEEKKEKE